MSRNRVYTGNTASYKSGKVANTITCDNAVPIDQRTGPAYKRAKHATVARATTPNKAIAKALYVQAQAAKARGMVPAWACEAPPETGTIYVLKRESGTLYFSCPMKAKAIAEVYGYTMHHGS